jgi:hypothetical protein
MEKFKSLTGSITEIEGYKAKVLFHNSETRMFVRFVGRIQSEWITIKS